MPHSPHQSHSGKQYELRVTASNLEFDEKLAAHTTPEARRRLPGFLHLFSQRRFLVDIDDRDIDGNSHTENHYRAFLMKTTRHHRNKFSLNLQAEKERLHAGKDGLRIHVGLQLGMQAAKEIMIEPFFTPEERDEGVIPMYYAIPEPIHGRGMEVAVGRLQEFLFEHPKGIVDELMLVENAVKHRSLRTRNRPEPPVAIPLDVAS